MSQRITGTSNVILTNRPPGWSSRSTSRRRPVDRLRPPAWHRTTVQTDRPGLVFDPGTISGAGSFTWYGGAALTTGRLDPKTLLYTDVESQHTVGLEGDVCDMLVSGLKTRH